MSSSIILLGAPGSGKGTQAIRLHNAFKLYNFSLGNIIRQEISLNSSIGNTMKVYSEAGLLIPDEVIVKLVEQFFFNFPENQLISDGFPRNLFQAEVLDNIFINKNISLPMVFYLRLDLNLLLNRLLGRRVCDHCGTIFHIHFSPPKIKDICDLCQSGLVIRTDDSEEVIVKRFNIFQSEINPLLNYYNDRVLIVDAHHSPDIVFESIAALLQKI